jgi:hypothetical protein
MMPSGPRNGSGGAGAPTARRRASRLAHGREDPVIALQAQVFDVGSERLGDPQAVEGEQRHQGVVPGARQASGD